MAKQPPAQSFPKVGIRPTIDGRLRGVRESLEAQTLSLTRAAADLISNSLRYCNGEPVECVIADSTIGGVTEAGRAPRSSPSHGSGRH